MDSIQNTSERGATLSTEDKLLNRMLGFVILIHETYLENLSWSWNKSSRQASLVLGL